MSGGAKVLARWLGLLSLLALSALAQHGHPLVGSWSGDWGTDAETRHRVLLVLEYEDDAISGTIFDAQTRIAISSVTLDPSSWRVVLEADRKDAAGEVVHYVIEGTIENLGSVTDRALVGTWTQGGVRGDFRVIMN